MAKMTALLLMAASATVGVGGAYVILSATKPADPATTARTDPAFTKQVELVMTEIANEVKGLRRDLAHARESAREAKADRAPASPGSSDSSTESTSEPALATLVELVKSIEFDRIPTRPEQRVRSEAQRTALSALAQLEPGSREVGAQHLLWSKADVWRRYGLPDSVVPQGAGPVRWEYWGVGGGKSVTFEFASGDVFRTTVLE
jgi:hypothetical protein